jgi:hypothetical protein
MKEEMYSIRVPFDSKLIHFIVPAEMQIANPQWGRKMDRAVSSMILDINQGSMRGRAFGMNSLYLHADFPQ